MNNIHRLKLVERGGGKRGLYIALLDLNECRREQHET